MDPTKRQQLAELRKDRTKVIAGLRGQLNSLTSPDALKTLLHALVSLQETQFLLEQWDEFEKREAKNEKAASA
jgi:hypothetical protein